MLVGVGSADCSASEMLDISAVGMTLKVGTPFTFPWKAGREPLEAFVGSDIFWLRVPNLSVKLPTRLAMVGMVMYCGVLLILV